MNSERPTLNDEDLTPGERALIQYATRHEEVHVQVLSAVADARREVREMRNSVMDQFRHERAHRDQRDADQDARITALMGQTMDRARGADWKSLSAVVVAVCGLAGSALALLSGGCN